MRFLRPVRQTDSSFTQVYIDRRFRQWRHIFTHRDNKVLWNIFAPCMGAGTDVFYFYSTRLNLLYECETASQIKEADQKMSNSQKSIDLPLFFTVIMFPCGWLVMVTLIPVILSVNPGVEVKLTEKGIEYGEQSCRCFCFRVRSCGSSAFSFSQGDNWELLQFRKSSRKSRFQIFQGNREFLQLEKSNTACQSKASIYKEIKVL